AWPRRLLDHPRFSQGIERMFERGKVNLRLLTDTSQAEDPWMIPPDAKGVRAGQGGVSWRSYHSRCRTHRSAASKSQTRTPSTSTVEPASSRKETRQCATPRSPATAMGSTSVRRSVGTPPSTHARTIASRPCVSSRKGPKEYTASSANSADTSTGSFEAHASK